MMSEHNEWSSVVVCLETYYSSDIPHNDIYSCTLGSCVYRKLCDL